MSTLFQELKRRKVFRVATAYVVVAWVLLQVATTLLSTFEAPLWISQAFVILLILGFPLALILSWAYDITPEGIVADTIDSQSAAAEISVQPNGVAVLPLENICAQEGYDYFVDGMHAVLITSLSKISALNVFSRTSTRLYKDSAKSIREIGAELGAAKVIEGSVYRDSDLVQITVQLIDVATDTLNWSEQYDCTLSNILQVQRDAASDIAKQVSVVLTEDEQSRFSAVPRVTPQAYDAYLKGMHYWYQLTPDSLHKGISEFEGSIEADAQFAPAYAGIAACWAGLQQMGASDAAQTRPKILVAVEKALALDPNLAEAQFSLAVYSTWSAFDWNSARSAFEQTIELDASFPDGFAYYAHFLCCMGEHEKATAPIVRAVNLDPYNPLIRSLYTAVLLFQGKFEQALVELEKVVKTAPDHWLAYEILRHVHHHLGSEREALAATQTMYRLLGKLEVSTAMDEGFTSRGYREAMSRGGDTLAALAAQGETVSISQIALLYDFAGRTEDASEYIFKAYEISESPLPYLRQHYSEELLKQPLVLKVLEQMKFPEKTYAG
ncbi:MAG: hypothetical protein GKR91_06715 [Pseudomonadales bacterium]|nr:hypothetical protein [Pseudomonadales bacterium]